MSSLPTQSSAHFTKAHSIGILKDMKMTIIFESLIDQSHFFLGFMDYAMGTESLGCSHSFSESLSKPPTTICECVCPIHTQYLCSLCFHSNSLGIYHLQNVFHPLLYKGFPQLPIIRHRAMPTHQLVLNKMPGSNSVNVPHCTQALCSGKFNFSHLNHV